MKKVLLLATVIGFLLPGCTQYDEGPFITIYPLKERVSGSWFFEGVQYDGVDSTEHYRYQKIEMFYVKDMDGGAFTWNHNLLATSQDEYPLEGGRWKFFADRDSLEMVLYRNMLRDSTIIHWKINRLAYTEFWMERHLKNGQLLEWQLVKYVY